NNEGPLLPLSRLLQPALGKVLNARVRLDRRIAALTTIEAIRLHAAATGQLPASLDELRGAPPPLDPATGKPFAYSRAGDKALLSGPGLAGEKPNKSNTISYVLTLRQERP